MEFRDLKTQYQLLKPEIDKAIETVLKNANFISGQEVRELEKQLAEYVGVKHCITCGNGTDALLLALMAWGIGKGDAVFVPDFTFFASGEAPAMCGATPVFVDVKKDTFNISPESLEYAIIEVLKQGKLRPKVIVAVDLFGQPAEYDKIRTIAQKYDLLVLEDAAQGFGGAIGDKKACSFGDISTTSFFPAKPLGCYGDGGAVFTDNDEWAEIIRSLCVHGKGVDKYDNVRIGMNSRLDTIQAAVLIPKLRAFIDYELQNVNEVAAFYTEQLKDIVETPVVLEGYYSSWAQYCIKLPNEKVRDDLRKKLKEKEIPTMVYYPKPMHQQQAFERRCLCFEELNNTRMSCDTVLELPIHPYLKNEKIIEEIKRLMFTLL